MAMEDLGGAIIICTLIGWILPLSMVWILTEKSNQIHELIAIGFFPQMVWISDKDFLSMFGIFEELFITMILTSTFAMQMYGHQAHTSCPQSHTFSYVMH